MNITIKAKPVKYSAATKQALLSKIDRQFSYSFGGFGNGLVGLFDYNRNVVRVYNLHKINAKYDHNAKFKSGPRKGQRKPSVKVRDSQWIAYVYDLDCTLLNLAKLQVTQNHRNFTIKTRK